jgi:hypothetical protein
MKAIWIRVDQQMVEPAEFGSYDELRKMVGGWLEVARTWSNGDALYVDEEGLLKLTEGSTFFTIAGGHQPFAGNGVIVGREPPEEGAGGLTNYDPTITVEEVRAIVAFRTPTQMLAWARGNASEPAASVTTFGPGGKRETMVVSTFGEMFGVQPPSASGRGR